MKQLYIALTGLLLLSTSCAHQILFKSNIWFEISVTPNDRVCATSQEPTGEKWAKITIFIRPHNLAPGTPVTLLLDSEQKIILQGELLELDVQKAGLGAHMLYVIVGDLVRSKNFSVLDCPPFEGDALHKKDGTLKGYEDP